MRGNRPKLLSRSHKSAMLYCSGLRNQPFQIKPNQTELAIYRLSTLVDNVSIKCAAIVRAMVGGKWRDGRHRCAIGIGNRRGLARLSGQLTNDRHRRTAIVRVSGAIAAIGGRIGAPYPPWLGSDRRNRDKRCNAEGERSRLTNEKLIGIVSVCVYVILFDMVLGQSAQIE